MTEWLRVSDNYSMTSSDPFVTGVAYRCEIVIRPASGYNFTPTATATLNGATATIFSQTASQIVLYRDFTVGTPPPTAPAITSGASASFVNGTGGTFQVAATGATPITFSLDGTEPAGVSINTTSGLITIAASTAVGTHTFTITAANGTLPNATQTFTLTVTATAVAPSITSGATTSVVNGTGGTYQVAATGTAPITFSLDGTEPAGVSINATSGLITIAASTAVGTHTFTVTATNGAGSDMQSFTLTVTPPASLPVITTAAGALTAGTVGTAYSVTLAATNSPTSWTVASGTLPGALTLNNSGVISGTPTATGTFNFSITATNGGGTSTAVSFSITVSAAASVAPTITSANSATVAAGGTFAVTATGTAPITYSLSGQPAGVSINGASGLITISSSTAVGTHTFTITAANGTSPNATQSFTLTVTAPPPPPTSYNVTIGAFTGGSVISNRTTATAGTTVTLTISPSAGYELDAITARRTSSSATTVTLNGTGLSRTFTMPTYNVTVEAAFKKTAAQLLWEKALAVIEAAVYEAPQSAAESDLAAWLADYINGLLSAAGIPLTVTAADIHVTSGVIIPSATGVNGSFSFFVLPPNVTGSTLISGTIVSTVGNEQLTMNNEQLKAYAENGILHVSGLAAGVEWRLYNVMGTLIYGDISNATETTLPLPQRGVYIVTDGKSVITVVN
jgi:hypothetical protein